jgi:hypothetical protein
MTLEEYMNAKNTFMLEVFRQEKKQESENYNKKQKKVIKTKFKIV